MPKAPNENRAKAKQMFEDGMALVEIAGQLGISEGTVRSWKSREGWGGKKKKGQKKTNAALQKNGATLHSQTMATPKKKRGAPSGNKNCKGKKNAKGNSGNPDPTPPPLRHGGYSNAYWNVLSDEEKEMIMEIHSEPEMIYMDQVKLLSVREHRLMKAINKYREMEFQKEGIGGLYISGTVQIQQKRSFKNAAEEAVYNEMVREKIEKGERMPGERYTLQTHTQATIDLIARLERELSYVQGQKTKALDSLTKFRFERQKIESASVGNDVVDDWINAILADDDEQEDDDEPKDIL